METQDKAFDSRALTAEQLQSEPIDDLIVSAEELMERPHMEQSFLIGPNLLPQPGRLLITGQTGTGKSILTLTIASQLASGLPIFGITNTHKDANFGEPRFPVARPYRVLYLDYEIPEAIRGEFRLKPMAARFPLPQNLTFAKHPTLYRLHTQTEDESTGSFRALKILVDRVRPDVLIMDPLSSTHSLDENSIDMKRGLNNADQLIDLFGCTVILVHHASSKALRNASGEKITKAAIEAPRGHSSLVDWPDVHIHFEAAEDSVIAMTFGKTRYSRRPEKRLLAVDFASMEVRPMPKFEASAQAA